MKLTLPARFPKSGWVQDLSKETSDPRGILNLEFFSLGKMKSKTTNNHGQMTIFFALTLVFLFTLMAFLVNIGMFVKAKINLQNAVDAAAWSGAAVQARQLTDIAYMNWELRNAYKEFIFKYYVLGQLSNPNTQINGLGSGDGAGGGDLMKFNLNTPQSQSATGLAIDGFNVPSICIQFNAPGGRSANICAIYSVPGIPRFGPVGLPGLDETQNEFLNRIVRAKANDCTKRSNVNFQVATNWLYAVKTDASSGSTADLFGAQAQIASNRMGAFPAALEIALRIRNLEKMVNTPPRSGVCRTARAGCTDVQSLEQVGNNYPFNERTIKAYWAGYRNISNTAASDFLGTGDGDQSVMKNTFKLTELAPPGRIPSGTSSSLIPSTQSDEKFYLDLRLNLINFGVFFNSFVSQLGETDLDGENVSTQGECNVTKVAIPMPGYPLSFEKNPNFLTYYAVKGEASFKGLLNPFNERVEGVKLEAFSAAKPFGGRIGPYLFRNDGSSIRPRDDNQKRSKAYVAALVPANAQTIPIPIMPFSNGFWAEDVDSVIGGQGNQNEEILFTVPNILYSGENLAAQSQGGAKINLITAGQAPDAVGLYDVAQYQELRNILERAKANNGGIVNARTIEEAILEVRSPTRYEALNYLIPYAKAPGVPELHTVAYIQNAANREASPSDPASYLIDAPLFGPSTYYTNVRTIGNEVEEYVDEIQPAIDKYIQSLRDLAAFVNAESAFAQNQGQSGGIEREDLLTDAAAGIAEPEGQPLSCLSLAGQVSSFFKKQPICGIPTLDELIVESINTRATSPIFSRYYEAEYIAPSNAVIPPGEQHLLSTGYMPGPRVGAEPNGNLQHPFLNSPQGLARRAFYSTKFIPFKSIVANGENTGFSSIAEGITGFSQNDPPDLQPFSNVENFLTAPEVRNLNL